MHETEMNKVETENIDIRLRLVSCLSLKER